jgi:hypothetical protein
MFEPLLAHETWISMSFRLLRPNGSAADDWHWLCNDVLSARKTWKLNNNRKTLHLIEPTKALIYPSLSLLTLTLRQPRVHLSLPRPNASAAYGRALFFNYLKFESYFE